MKFTKIICIILAIIFIVTAANSAVARQKTGSLKIKDILKSGLLRSEEKSEKGGIIAQFLNFLHERFSFPLMERNKVPDVEDPPEEEEPEEEEPEEEPDEPIEERAVVKGKVSEFDVLEGSTRFLSDVKIEFYLPTISNEALYTTSTIEDGSYIITDVDEGVYTAKAIKEGYEIETQELRIDFGEVKKLDFILNNKEKLVDLDFSIKNVQVDEQIYGNSISVMFSFKNNGEESVTLSRLDLGGSLSVKITKPDSEVLNYGALEDQLSPIMKIGPDETHNKVVEIIDEDGYLSSKGTYKIQGFYKPIDDSDIEISSTETQFEIKTDRNIVDKINDFSLRLFKDFLPGKDIETDGGTSGRITRAVETSFSPAFIWLGLHMLKQGSAGITYDEITNVLGIDENDENVLNDIKDTYDRYLNPQSDAEGVSINNAIWLDEDQEDIFSQSYIDTLEEEYNYDVHSLDFSTNSEAVDSLDTIEDWVRDTTNDMLKNPDFVERNFKPRAPVTMGVPVISSTFYLNVEWEKPFDSTIKKSFYFKQLGSNVFHYIEDISFLRGSFKNLNYAETDDLQVLDLPCSGDISMLIMLPKMSLPFNLGGPEVIAKYINKESLVEWQKSFSSNKWADYTFDVRIPMTKRKIDAVGESGIPSEAIIKKDMTRNLKDMGMMQAFSEQYADFSKMIGTISDDDNLFLRDVSQESYIQTNESGIQAATYIATSMIGKEIDIEFEFKPYESEDEDTLLYSDNEENGYYSEGQYENTYNQDSPDTIVFNADHPFSFIIHDKKGTILYMGTVFGRWVIISPIVLDLKGDGIKTSDLSDGVLFDLNNDGKKDLTGWTAGKDDAFLALDLNQNGIIDNGGELFGDNTILPDGKKASNGFEALAQYDTDKDQKIDKTDEIWSDLILWLDTNHNGISEQKELTPIKDSQVHEIYLDYSYLNKVDHGNLLRECSSFKNKDGTLGSIIDVWFKSIT